MALQENQKNVLHQIAFSLFENSYVEADTALIPELISQAVLPFVLPTNRLAASIIAQNMQVSYEHTELHNVLTKNKIPYVILKGLASASYYPNPILRTMGDVDFLVKEQDVARAGALLEGIGFRSEGDDGGIHIGYQRDNSTWELHRSVNGIPSGAAGELIQCCLSDIIETAVDYDEGNGTIRIPDDFHHGLILLLHTASHLTSEGVGLRHLCDWAVFVNHFTNEQFCSLFEEKLKACGLWRFAQLLSLTSVKYLGLSFYQWMGEADDCILDQLITDIMDGGNFGHKDEDRYRQIKYISNRGEHTVDEKSAILQLWDTIGKKADYMDTSRIAVIADYVSMILRGKRKMDRGSTVKRAVKRKRLYAEFHLFEQ